MRGNVKRKPYKLTCTPHELQVIYSALNVLLSMFECDEVGPNPIPVDNPAYDGEVVTREDVSALVDDISDYDYELSQEQYDAIFAKIREEENSGNRP